MKTTTLCAIAIALANASNCAAASKRPPPIDPKASGTTIAEQVCSTCHGASGTAQLPNVPNLAAQQQPYLAKQLHEFKGQTRSDPRAIENMWSVAHKLTDRQIDELAAHFAAQAPQRAPVEGKAEQIAAGKAIFTGGALAQGVPPCAGCHGTDGAGKTLFPRLAGQHSDYLVKQLMVFQNTNQRPNAAVMKSVTHDLTPEGVLDVAAYLQALPNENEKTP